MSKAEAPERQTRSGNYEVNPQGVSPTILTFIGKI